MFSLSKSWAILSGAVILTAGVVAGIVSYRLSPTGPIAQLVATVVPQEHAAASVPPAVASTEPTAPTPVQTAKAPEPKIAALAPVPQPGSKPASPPTDEGPHFDVVRVEPDGSAVVAGAGTPNASVALFASGKVIGEAKADTSGHFVILPNPLAPGGTTLTLRQTVEGNSAESRQSVAVSVPEKGQDKGGLVVALAEPGQATKLLSAPHVDAPASQNASSSPGAPALPQQQGLAIRSAEIENGSGFYATGTATPGTKVEVYLNNSHLADVVAGQDSGWSVKVREGMTPGHYSVRADALGASKSVTARVEVPFDVPVAAANEAAPSRVDAAKAAVTPVATAPAVASPSGSGPANVVVAAVRTAVVRSGDNLWDISRVQLGSGFRYTRIYAANATQIRDPDVIYPGQVFVVPTENN